MVGKSPIPLLVGRAVTRKKTLTHALTMFMVDGIFGVGSAYDIFVNFSIHPDSLRRDENKK
jgi:hypothetical protein